MMDLSDVHPTLQSWPTPTACLSRLPSGTSARSGRPTTASVLKGPEHDDVFADLIGNE